MVFCDRIQVKLFIILKRGYKYEKLFKKGNVFAIMHGADAFLCRLRKGKERAEDAES
jgi:hypothetical protein